MSKIPILTNQLSLINSLSKPYKDKGRRAVHQKVALRQIGKTHHSDHRSRRAVH